MARKLTFSNSEHWGLQYDEKYALYWKWKRCSLNSSKTILLRLELPERADNFFCLILFCSFSTLSIWPLTFTYQQISTRLPLISTKKLSINQNNLLRCSSKSKSRQFIYVSFKLQSNFFSNSSDVLPKQNLFLATKPFAISWNVLNISGKTMR